MARKIKFALEMADGAKVRGNIDELREHFDIESVVRYFLSGKLIEWLDDRYYESEAEALEQIDKDSPDFRNQLCEALGVEYKADDDLDVASLERLNEKRAILRQMTDDEEIIKNANKTALTQEDLADLLDMGEDLIYLCGEEFTIPARVKNKKYIGVLRAPQITIRVNSQDDLNEKGILFENVNLPWEKKSTRKQEQLTDSDNDITFKSSDADFNKIKDIFYTIFPQYKDAILPIWEVVTPSGNPKKIELTSMQKNIALNIVCHGEYQIDEIIFIRVVSDLSAGIAFTKNSFCDGGTGKNITIPYKDILSSEAYKWCAGGCAFGIDYKGNDSNWPYKVGTNGYEYKYSGLSGTIGKARKSASFLTTVGNLCREN